MRWALRNQEKIVAHFNPDGEKMLDRIKRSLDFHFGNFNEIETQKRDKDPYPVLRILNDDNTSEVIEFYVIRRKYDVYNLAFKGFTAK